MPTFLHDGITFRYHERGEGLPFVFQHGLGSDGRQAFELIPSRPRTRLLALDCRAHGETRPLGPVEQIGFAQYAEDLLALLDVLDVEQAVVGGLSLGAGVALAFALRYPERVSGLVLSRPAWLDRPAPANLHPYGQVARLIRTLGPARGHEAFLDSADHRDLAKTHPTSAQSLASQFRERRAAEAVVRLERLPNDAPSRDRRAWEGIDVPTLILASREDFIHPFDFAVELARAIRGAALRELTPKAVSVEAHVAETRDAILGFLRRDGRG